jgi:hypothetical protein
MTFQNDMVYMYTCVLLSWVGSHLFFVRACRIPFNIRYKVHLQVANRFSFTLMTGQQFTFPLGSDVPGVTGRESNAAAFATLVNSHLLIASTQVDINRFFFAICILQLRSYPGSLIDLKLQDSSLPLAAFNNYQALYDLILSRYIIVFRSRPPHKPDIAVLATSPGGREQWVHFFGTLLSLVCNDEHASVQVDLINRMSITVQAGLMQLIGRVSSRSWLMMFSRCTDCGS